MCKANIKNFIFSAQGTFALSTHKIRIQSVGCVETGESPVCISQYPPGQGGLAPPGIVSSVMYQYIISHNEDMFYLLTGSLTPSRFVLVKGFK